jgi:hypothetical protein
MESTPNIELSERMYKRLERIVGWWESIKGFFRAIHFLYLTFKPKKLQIVGIEFLTKEGTPFHFHLGERYHIDDHSGVCLVNMHCKILPIKKIVASKDKVKVFYDGDHRFIYSQVSIRTTYLKKV